MKISLNWLKDFVSIKLTPKELAEQISAKLTEVEAVSDQAERYQGLVAVKIEELTRHPNSDHLWLVTAFDGVENRHIVCGAQNLAIGQIVPLITPGSKVPNSGDVIKESVIRGEKSDGMLASPHELGISDDHEGILILDQKIRPGTPLAEAQGLDDVVLEIENKALTHRGDCFSHIGIAREVGAITGEKMRESALDKGYEGDEGNIKINIENTTDCPRYMAAHISNVKIGPSPEYIQKRLTSCGMRPINNIVDFTNYVMLETGQPLHAFDASRLPCRGESRLAQNTQGGACVTPTKEGLYNLGVRRARQDETIETLDGSSRKLTPDNIVITSFNQPVAVAGVMGGSSSEINSQTTEIIIEAANFNHYAIRKSSRVLGLRTEASMRYEKNLDPNLVEQGMARIISLIEETSAGEVESVTDEYPQPILPAVIKIDIKYICDRLGVKISEKQISEILESLGFTTSQNKDKELEVTVPTWRRDVAIPEDLIEEIARIYGYEKIVPTLPSKTLAPVGLTTSQKGGREIVQLLKELTYNEVYSYSFVGDALYKKAKLLTESLLAIVNPLSPELEYLRDSLVPQVLEKVAFNIHNFSQFKLFEMGRELISSGLESKLPKEVSKITAAVYDKGVIDQETLYRGAKGDLEAVLDKFNITDVDWVEDGSQHFWSALAQVKVGGVILGSISIISETVLNNFGIKGNVVLWEIELTTLFDISMRQTLEIKNIPGYPPIIEDISFYVKPKTRLIGVIREMREISKLISEVEVCDVYKAESAKSVTLQITYQDNTKPLSDKDVAPIRTKIIDLLSKKYELDVRQSS